MTKLLFKIGNLVIFSRKHKRVRRSVLLLVSNLFLAAGVIFVLEIALIFMGVGNIYLPLTRSARDFLSSIIF